jgi:hypothetical protein
MWFFDFCTDSTDPSKIADGRGHFFVRGANGRAPAPRVQQATILATAPSIDLVIAAKA